MSHDHYAFTSLPDIDAVDVVPLDGKMPDFAPSGTRGMSA